MDAILKKERREKALKAFGELLDIMDRLRAECPWDKKQTLESLRYLSIEETYELSDAIINNDLDEIKKELGDIMLHIVFYAKIGEEKNAFNIADVLESINEKLIRRHPHIFSDVEAKTDEDVKNNWEKIKMKEGRKSVLEGVPNSLPAMVKAYRMQEKARGIGFDWENSDQVFEKVKEEFNELMVELPIENNHQNIENEFGDLLFALINWSRFIDVNPEDALERTNKKFKQRLQYIEQKALENNKQLHDMTLAEMDIWWNEAKKYN